MFKLVAGHAFAVVHDLEAALCLGIGERDLNFSSVSIPTVRHEFHNGGCWIGHDGACVVVQEPLIK
ncbi:hypothetical protein [Burkholderia ubonensis]|uniref:hypothetical protein n=1 Tax=Burkholderia ubonensis TaxID=101571 RepID=UPI001E479F00|nr:hypothetical protein [Burkholderia ubonensis]